MSAYIYVHKYIYIFVCFYRRAIAAMVSGIVLQWTLALSVGRDPGRRPALAFIDISYDWHSDPHRMCVWTKQERKIDCEEKLQTAVWQVHTLSIDWLWRMSQQTHDAVWQFLLQPLEGATVFICRTQIVLYGVCVCVTQVCVATWRTSEEICVSAELPFTVTMSPEREQTNQRVAFSVINYTLCPLLYLKPWMGDHTGVQAHLPVGVVSNLRHNQLCVLHVGLRCVVHTRLVSLRLFIPTNGKSFHVEHRSGRWVHKLG